jgi:hypothetical protein
MTARTIAIVAAIGIGTAVVRAQPIDTKTASYALAFRDIVSAYRDMAVFVLPGSRVTIDAAGGPAGDYALSTHEGIAEQLAARRWRWTAPDRPGMATLRFQGPGASGSSDEIVLHAFVMVPASAVKGGMLNGYRIGTYPPPLHGNAIYRPPPGFVEVTRENQDTKLSPHFRLKQFLCKEDTSKTFPKYVVVQEKLLLKLEAVLERVNAIGFQVDTLHVMSAYRTPFYNRAIGDVKYSMHQFGGAADVYVDRERKDRMDDLNRDGAVDVRDSKFLYDQIESLMSADSMRRLEGGLGFYHGTSAHPPFVHVDVRGAAARWQG